MPLTGLIALYVFLYPCYAISRLAHIITDDGQGKSIYIFTAGSTSSVAAPAFTPTLV